MNDLFHGLAFTPADLLLPRNCDLKRWSVVACDQYTAQPEYWQRVAEFVGTAPSTLALVLPESCLDGPNVGTDIVEVNNNMTRYLREDRFQPIQNAMIYVERRLRGGGVRRGLVGKLDLERYDYETGAQSLIRSTEGVVPARIPSRVAVRKNARLELSHVMVLVDDPEAWLFDPLTAAKDRMEKLYDFSLMEDGGHLTGWKLDEEALAQVASALRRLEDPKTFRSRYGQSQPMAYAVGDGNHSLATAKECYERQKRMVPPSQWAGLPARYAMVELTNLREKSLKFEPIHRILFGVAPRQLLSELKKAFHGAYEGQGPGQVIHYIAAGQEGFLTVPRPQTHLLLAALQPFLDDYLIRHGGGMDYIHGEDVLRSLAAGTGCMGFLLPAIDKGSFFAGIARDGILPRKTFSMGQAHDKRFYLEARKIR